MIRQELLRSYHESLSRARAAESAARALRDIADRQKVELLARLKAQERQQAGCYCASIAEGPRRPAWKEMYIRDCGAAAAEAIIAATAPSESIDVQMVAAQEARARRRA